jgi:hypothetical protein
MKSTDVIGYTVFFWTVLLIYGVFFEIRISMIMGFIVYVITAVLIYFIIRELVSRGYYLPVSRISAELKEYILRVSVIISFFLFCTGVIAIEGFTGSNMIALAVATLFIGILYKLFKMVAHGVINTVVGVITGLMPPPTRLAKHENSQSSPVATRTFRTKKDGKDITHVLIRIDNDAKKDKS